MLLLACSQLCRCYSSFSHKVTRVIRMVLADAEGKGGWGGVCGGDDCVSVNV
jgi:hypothetical protein